MANVETLEEKWQVFEAFSRALVRESHNLMQRPDLLWQQLYNRLQWEEEPVPAVLQPEYGRRTTPSSAPWFRTRTPFRESEALIRTLQGHTAFVWGCAVSPDGSFIVSASNDNTLKVWDARTWEERATLEGHTDEVSGCAVSPDGSFIVSASRDNTLKVWDAKTGKERATLQGHTSRVHACAVSPDGSFIISASHDKTLKMWDAATGTERASIALLGGLQCVALHPRHPLAASGDEGGNVYIMDMALEYGLAIVTATDFGQGYVIRCPGCSKVISFQEEWLGQEITCPQESCRTQMKVNPFVVGDRKRSSGDKGTKPKPSGSEQSVSKTKKIENAKSPEKKEQVTESRRAPKGKKWWQLWR